MLNTVFISACHLCFSWDRWIRSRPCLPITLRCILMWYFHLRLGLPSGILHSVPTRTTYVLLVHSCHMPRPSHLPWFNDPNNMVISTICGVHYAIFIQSHLPVSILGPNIFLVTPISNTARLYSSLSLTDRVSHPSKTSKRHVYFLYSLIANEATKYPRLNSSRNSLNPGSFPCIYACDLSKRS